MQQTETTFNYNRDKIKSAEGVEEGGDFDGDTSALRTEIYSFKTYYSNRIETFNKHTHRTSRGLFR